MTPQPTLTPRQQECVNLVCDGKTDIEIAIILGISPRTTRFHVENARAKYGATNRPHLVSKMLRWETQQ